MHHKISLTRKTPFNSIFYSTPLLHNIMQNDCDTAWFSIYATTTSRHSGFILKPQNAANILIYVNKLNQKDLVSRALQQRKFCRTPVVYLMPLIPFTTRNKGHTCLRNYMVYYISVAPFIPKCLHSTFLATSWTEESNHQYYPAVWVEAWRFSRRHLGQPLPVTKNAMGYYCFFQNRQDFVFSNLTFMKNMYLVSCLELTSLPKAEVLLQIAIGINSSV